MLIARGAARICVAAGCGLMLVPVPAHTVTTCVCMFVCKFIAESVNNFASESVGVWCMCEVLDKCTRPVCVCVCHG